MITDQYSSRQRGFLSIELTAILAVIMILAPVGYQYLIRAEDMRQAEIIGQQLKTTREAGQRYIEDNLSQIQQRAASGPVNITTGMLRSSGYLPASFSERNVFDQRHQITVIRDPDVPTNLRALVTTTGGQHIPERSLRRAAQASGISGGFISSLSPTDAQGLYGSWNEPLVLYQQEHIGAGHIASVMYFDRGALEPNYLYRIPVAGRPDLNTMSAHLNMGDHDVQDAGNINATALITRGDQGWYSRDHGGGFYMDNDQTIKITNDKDLSTGGHVNAHRVRAGEYIELNGIAQQGVACNPNGLLSRESNGELVSCVDGRWKKSGGDIGFKTFSAIPYSGIAATDGIIFGITGFNTWSAGWVNGVQIMEQAARDKYGVGHTSFSFPVRKGDHYGVHGAWNGLWMMTLERN